MQPFDPDQVPDDLLVEQARGGHDGAFDALMTRYSGRVFRLATRLSGSTADAEEILQDTFLQVYRKLESFRGEAKFSTWLYRIATNAALMHLRKNQRHKADPLDEHHTPAAGHPGAAPPPARADELMERGQVMQRTLAAVAALPEIYRMTFVLRDLEDLSTEETAQVLEVEEGAVRQRLHRARLMLREQLGDLAQGGDAS